MSSFLRHTQLQSAAQAWFEELRNRICAAFEAIESQTSESDAGGNNAGGSNVVGSEAASPARFAQSAWDRTNEDGSPGGGGVISLMRGRVFEKVGVNVSTVHGTFAPAFAASIPGADINPAFHATGISLVAHMANPHVPAVHFNSRMLTTTQGWFGGGGDITPMFPASTEAAADADCFHQGFRNACDRHDPSYYPRFKEWCDRYFFLPHRNEPRGLGGIFFDHLATQNPDDDFAFTRDVGAAFLETYPGIVRRRMHTPFTPQDRQAQKLRRGRYVEFNLLHDRGTLFGLKTNGNVDAILMSLPPEVSW